MQISRAGEYGVLGMLHLARQAPGQVVMLSDVSRGQQIPHSFLAKIFQSLARAGLVESCRGVGGGFTLARRPGEITVLEVIEAIEGPIALQRCQVDAAACRQINDCPLCGLLGQAQDQVRETFARTSLADLAAGPRGPGGTKTGRPTSRRRPLAGIGRR